MPDLLMKVSAIQAELDALAVQVDEADRPEVPRLLRFHRLHQCYVRAQALGIEMDLIRCAAAEVQKTSDATRRASVFTSCLSKGVHYGA